jgi:heavy metal sensor kinase
VDTQLDPDATNELTDRVEGLRGYLEFKGDTPALHYNQDVPEISLFVRNATRFYQIYDLTHGGLVDQSPDMRLLGLSFVPQELELSRNGILDVNTDEGPLRFLNTRMKSPSGTDFLLQVGLSLKPMHDALHRIARLGLWLGPLALVLAATSGWFLAGSALTPVRDIVHAVRRLELSTLHQRLPISGTNDELDQLAVTFNDAFGRLDAAVAEMKQLMGSMAHELRTPLAALRGEAEIALLHGSSIEELKRVLGSQLEEIDRLSRLIGRILTVTKAESGLLSLERKPVDIAALLNDLAETLSVIASARDISLGFETAPHLVASGDAQWLKHALLNVLDNAIKYTPEGGSVAVRGYENAIHVVIEVQDTGIGIPADALPHIFKRFYRAETSRAKDIEGVGLGLNLTKWIVDHHGGKIEVSSQPGSGTRVELCLPRSRVRNDQP